MIIIPYGVGFFVQCMEDLMTDDDIVQYLYAFHKDALYRRDEIRLKLFYSCGKYIGYGLISYIEETNGQKL